MMTRAAIPESRFGVRTLRIVCFLLVVFVLAQIVTYRYLALFIGRSLFGIQEDTGYAILSYVVLRVLPAGLLFLVIVISITLQTGLKRPGRLPFWIVLTVAADLLLLAWSVGHYYRSVVGVR